MQFREAAWIYLFLSHYREISRWNVRWGFWGTHEQQNRANRRVFSFNHYDLRGQFEKPSYKHVLKGFYPNSNTFTSSAARQSIFQFLFIFFSVVNVSFTDIYLIHFSPPQRKHHYKVSNNVLSIPEENV